jgi:hypothetical protein
MTVPNSVIELIQPKETIKMHQYYYLGRLGPVIRSLLDTMDTSNWKVYHTYRQ